MVKLIGFLVVAYVFYQLIKVAGNLFTILKNNGRNRRNFSYDGPAQREGKTDIDYVPENRGKSGEDANHNGEYIDYEEVKE